MKEKDIRIVSHLRKNSRTSLTKLSEKTNIPVSTIFDRIRANEKKDILRHTTLLNYNKIGLNTRAQITVKVAPEDKEALKDFLMKHPYVNSVYRINSGYDFMFEGIFKEDKDLDDFFDVMESMFKINEKNSYMITEELKTEAFLADTDMSPYIGLAE